MACQSVLEIVQRFETASYETQKVEGHWRYEAVLYRDNLVKVVIDVPDTKANRQWMIDFKSRWRVKFEQLDLWLVSYQIEID